MTNQFEEKTTLPKEMQFVTSFDTNPLGWGATPIIPFIGIIISAH